MSGVIGNSTDMKGGVVGAYRPGSVVQMVFAGTTAGQDHITTSATELFNSSITYKTSNPIVYVQCQGLWGFTSAATGVTDGQYETKLKNNTTNTNLNQIRSFHQFAAAATKNFHSERSICWAGSMTVAAGVTHEYGFYGWTTNATYTRFTLNRHSTSGDQGDTFLTITEFAT